MSVTAGQSGSSYKALTTTLQRALNGSFSPRGKFSSRDLDISFLAKATIQRAADTKGKTTCSILFSVARY
jgi:hypothetical protein